jgi:hypothetical protein
MEESKRPDFFADRRLFPILFDAFPDNFLVVHKSLYGMVWCSGRLHSEADGFIRKQMMGRQGSDFTVNAATESSDLTSNS